MTWLPIDIWIVVIAALCAAACALPGTFLVLRGSSMMGDAISHAVLPGIAVAFLLTQARDSGVMFLGAAATGVLTALFAQWVHRFGHVDRGASMGVVFTGLFALGLVLIVQAADRVDLDPDCVLHGALDLAPLDRTEVLGLSLPRAVPVLAAVLGANGLLAALFLKELRVATFDPDFADSQGISSQAMHLGLMAATAITTVACFEILGSILVIAMLVVPAAAAHLLTDRLVPTIVIAVIVGALASVSGHLAALGIGVLGPGVSSAGTITVMLGVLLAGAALGSPAHGVLARLVDRRHVRGRVLREDLLALLWRVEEQSVPLPAGDGAAAALATATDRPTRAVRGALGRLVREGLVDASRRALTDAGRRTAAELVRTHRLWERYLHEVMGVAPDHVHGTAHRVEHLTTPEMRRRLEAASDATGDDVRDPHGRPLPGGDPN